MAEEPTAPSGLGAAIEPDSQAAIAAPFTSPTAEQLAVGSRTAATNGDGASPDNVATDEAEVGLVPATASASTSSLSTPGDSIAAPSPYGTRSRNRGPNARPNYAEDREMDHDYEVTTAEAEVHHNPDSDAGPTASEDDSVNPHASTTQPPVKQPRLHFVVPSGSAATREAMIPGTGSFPVDKFNAPSQNPKKRKAAQATGMAPIASKPAQTAVIVPQPSNGRRETFMLSFDNCKGRLKGDCLVADDGTELRPNDHIFLVCEPPGEPYYIARIMEFLHADNDLSAPVDAVRVNWYYRPKDIGRQNTDTRMLFASMHSDTSPLTAIRGVIDIRHKSEIKNMDDFRRQQNCFWFDRMYDRYIHRYYEVIPTGLVVNVPANVKRVLDDRWKYILVEAGRAKELTSAVKSCKRCAGYCAMNDSVDCAVCKQTYHMECVRPPLLKKPSRGFAWACGPCSRAQERRLQERHKPSDTGAENDDEAVDEEEEDLLRGAEEATEEDPPAPVQSFPPIEPGTAEQIRQASLWQFRYLGMHCRVEDALDYDDRIYPRASSRLGKAHQADVLSWPGRPFEFVRRQEVKRKYVKATSHKKDAKLSKDTVTAIEAEKAERDNRPKWVVDEPPGYMERGHDLPANDPDSTATLLFSAPENVVPEDESGSMGRINDFLIRAQPFADKLKLPIGAANFIDKAVNLLFIYQFNEDLALRDLARVTRKDLKEPDFTPLEIKKFEDGIAKYGSELHSVRKHVKTVHYGSIVRFYYSWKKSDRGKIVWGGYGGRKNKKEVKRAEKAERSGKPDKTELAATKAGKHDKAEKVGKSDDANSRGKLLDDIADDRDDSAFDNDKANAKRVGFECKFCSTRSSRQWRRAPQTPVGTTVAADPNYKATGKDKGPQLIVALCINCAVVWRKYAVQWDESESAKTVAAVGPRGGRRKAEDPMREFQLTETVPNSEGSSTPVYGTPAPLPQEPARKKMKNGDVLDNTVDISAPKKKTITEKPLPPPVPEMPKPKVLPCAVCAQLEPLVDQLVSCKKCRLSVHRNCYGIIANAGGKWVCDTCTNDESPKYSLQYECTLCPNVSRTYNFVEPPKVSHKKKTEKDREKDRIDREMADKAAAFYQKKQDELPWPSLPREPLKHTEGTNWMHVTCAVWMPEIKFGNSHALEPVEGQLSVPLSRFEDLCVLCEQPFGACVNCQGCKRTVHIECARQRDWGLAFEINPVKGSRKDVANLVNVDGTSGIMSPIVWCPEHEPKTGYYQMHDIIGGDQLNALQLYVRTYKQADLALAGTVRKATMMSQSAKSHGFGQSTQAHHATTRTGSISYASLCGAVDPTSVTAGWIKKTCVTCGVNCSARWHLLTSVTSNTDVEMANAEQTARGPPEAAMTNDIGVDHAVPVEAIVPSHMALASAALETEPMVEPIAIEYQCHKCFKNKVERAAPTPPRRNGLLEPSGIGMQPLAVSTATRSPSMDHQQVNGTRSLWAQNSTYSPPPHRHDWPTMPSTSSEAAAPPIHHYAPSPATLDGVIAHPGLNDASRLQETTSHSPHVNGGGSGIQMASVPGIQRYYSHGMMFGQDPGPPPPPLQVDRAQHNREIQDFQARNVGRDESHYGSSGGAPHIRDGQPIPPVLGPTSRPDNGRVNGGASNSPSLHNLLSH